MPEGRLVSDQHLHLEKGPYTPDDYPIEWLRRYVDVAQNRGVGHLGIVEHAYRFHEARRILDRPWSDARCRFDLAPYLRFVERCREAELPASFGVEMDYVPGKEEETARFLALGKWDFVLGSVHFVGDIGVDMETDRGRALALGRALWDGYFETSERAVRSGLFQVLTHPDLPKIWGDRASHDLLPDYERMARALKAAAVAIELNTAGWRKPVGEAYPAPDLLRAALRQGVALSLASDAHVPEDAGRDFDRALALVQEIGFTKTVRFVAGRAHRDLLPSPEAPRRDP